MRQRSVAAIIKLPCAMGGVLHLRDCGGGLNLTQQSEISTELWWQSSLVDTKSCGTREAARAQQSSSPPGWRCEFWMTQREETISRIPPDFIVFMSGDHMDRFRMSVMQNTSACLCCASDTRRGWAHRSAPAAVCVCVRSDPLVQWGVRPADAVSGSSLVWTKWTSPGGRSVTGGRPPARLSHHY